MNYRNRPVCFTLIFRQFHFQLLLHKQHATIWGLQRLQGNIDFLTITLKQFDPTFSEGFYKTYILRDKFDRLLLNRAAFLAVTLEPLFTTLYYKKTTMDERNFPGKFPLKFQIIWLCENLHCNARKIPIIQLIKKDLIII